MIRQITQISLSEDMGPGMRNIFPSSGISPLHRSWEEDWVGVVRMGPRPDLEVECEEEHGARYYQIPDSRGKR